MHKTFTLLFALLAFPLQADDIAPALPALYAVTGVQSDDTLNIRAMPDVSAEIIGTLEPDATDIEVVGLSLQGNWAQVNVVETTGWVAMQYLSAQPVERTALGLPVGLQCFGTEPFWTLTFVDTPQVTIRTPEGESQHDVVSSAPAAEFVDLSDVGMRFEWRSDDTQVVARILPGRCSDGMSDRSYLLHYVDDQGPRIGCCSLN